MVGAACDPFSDIGVCGGIHGRMGVQQILDQGCLVRVDRSPGVCQPPHNQHTTSGSLWSAVPVSRSNYAFELSYQNRCWIKSNYFYNDLHGSQQHT